MIKKNIRFIRVTLGYVLNNLLATFFLLYYSFFNKFEISAEIGLTSSLILFFLQSFSGNARSLLFLKINFLAQFFILRFAISLILLILINVIFLVTNVNNYLLLIFLSTIFIFQWLFELILLHNELKNKFIIFNEYILVTGFFISSFIFFDIFYTNKIFIIFSIFLSYLLYQIIKFSIRINLLSCSLLNQSNNKFRFLPFFSSFSLTLANFLWRLLIFFFCGKTLAGIYFAAFSIGSLPGTIFNLTFRSKVAHYIIEKKKFTKKIFIISILLFFFIIFYLTSFKFIYSDSNKIYLFTALISILGSPFMLQGLHFRQILIQKLKISNKVFYIDVIYSLIIVLIIPLCFILGKKYLISFSFIISSLINYFMYRFAYHYYEKKI